MRHLFIFCALLALPGCSKSAHEKPAPTSTAHAALPASASSSQGETGSATASGSAASNALDAASAASSARAPSALNTGTLPVTTAAELRAKIRAGQRKGTLVNAFASWCGPCRAELPMLQAMAENLARQGVDVIVVSMDEPEDNAKARAFLESLHVRLPSYLAARPLSVFKEELYPRWPGMLPATFLFDAQGVAHYFWGGPAEDEEILTVVEGFLAGKNIDGEADFTLAPGAVNR